MSEIRRESPLADCKRLDQSTATPDQASVRLGERAGGGVINLRGSLQARGFSAAVASVLGDKLPGKANTWVAAGEHTACWLAPDEWLLLTAPGAEAALIAALREALAEQHAAVTDVTGGYAVITLAGPAVRATLAKGCTLDLHPRVFPTGSCMQSLLAKAGVVLIARAGDAVDVVVRRSFADYLWRWLVDAAEDAGVAVI